MTYYRDRLLLVSDSFNNIDLFRLVNKKITRYHFDKRTKTNNEIDIATDANIEYDVYISENDNIYIAYQDVALNLVLIVLEEGKIEKIKLTEEPMPEIYYLNILLVDDEPHIFYFALLSGKDKKYRIYHHYPSSDSWVTNIVDEIEVRELLNSMNVLKTEKELISSYYDYTEKEQICIKEFNLENYKWGEKIELTENEENKLYLDLLHRDNKIHLTYCQYEEGSLLTKYERFNYENGFVIKEVEEVISNPGNIQNPTLIYYDNKLWISWIEHEKVMSRYSDNGGDTWSPIYLWKESRGNSIVRYKYCSSRKSNNTILNYSFGKIKSDISFIGFGPLNNVEEVPVKKKIRLKTLENLPRIRI